LSGDRKAGLRVAQAGVVIADESYLPSRVAAEFMVGPDVCTVSAVGVAMKIKGHESLRSVYVRLSADSLFDEREFTLRAAVGSITHADVPDPDQHSSFAYLAAVGTIVGELSGQRV
jgi:hypothetical protein